MRARSPKETKEKKSSLAYLLASLLSLFFLVFLIYFIDPATFFIIPLFFISAFLFVFSVVSIFVDDMRKRLIVSVAVVAFLILRFFKMGNIINFFLLLGITITILVYESYSKKTD